jgi:hypothetical protein
MDDMPVTRRLSASDEATVRISAQEPGPPPAQPPP